MGVRLRVQLEFRSVGWRCRRFIAVIIKDYAHYAGNPRRGAKYEAVIGLEVHVQLLTKTEDFLRLLDPLRRPPNSNVCPVCLGLPGALPVLNRQAVELAVWRPWR